MDAAELPGPPPVAYTADPETPIPADLSLPEPEQAEVWPPPLVTSRDPLPEGVTFPPSVKTLERKAASLGYEATTTYAYGFKPGRTKGTWAPLEAVCVRLTCPARPAVVFTWERSPESTAKNGPAWKAEGALFIDGLRHARRFGHTEAKALLAPDAPWPV